MHLDAAAKAMSGHLAGENAVFERVVIDSRQVQQGDLYFAIPGEKFDGHDFIAQACEAGANGAVISRPDVITQKSCPTVSVEDTTVALGCLGQSWRQHFDVPVVAVTGSNGKTTVTAMIASIFGQSGPCVFPQGSFNNHWGVPLTLLKLRSEHEYAVIEMGMNHQGEIHHLSNMASPTIALITNAAPAHLEGLGSVENVAKAKSEIFDGLVPNGSAVINADDSFSEFWQARAEAGNIILFGEHTDAAVRALNVTENKSGFQFDLEHNDQSVCSIQLNLLGRHNIHNALAAAAVGIAAGCDVDSIKTGLENVAAVKGRLEKKAGLNGALIIDDTYNANPASMTAAVKTLNQFKGKRIAVLGAMAELGAETRMLHESIGRLLRESDVEQLFILGDGDNGYLQGYGDKAQSFSEIKTLLNTLSVELNNNTVVLVKGSRSSAMERVVDAIQQSEEQFK